MELKNALLENVENYEDLHGYFTNRLKKTFGDNFIWLFSKNSLLRRKFSLALKQSSSQSKFKKFEHLALKMSLKKIDERRYKRIKLINDALAYIFLRYFLENDLTKATDIFEHLQKQKVNARLENALRIKLLQLFIVLDPTNSRIENLLISVISDADNKNLFNKRIILKTLDHIYSKFGPSTCLEVINKSCTYFKLLAQSKSIISLCKCPKSFNDAQNAHKWETLINCKDYSFSQSMQHDAFLIHSKVSEWYEKYESMNQYAKDALTINLESPVAKYWVYRSLLQKKDCIPVLPEMDTYSNSDEAWKRLAYAIKLYEKRDVCFIEDVLVVLRGKYGNPDIQEESLFIKILEGILQPSLKRSNDEIKEYSDFSKKLLKIKAGLGFATLNVVIDFLVNENNYKKAYSEIQKKECINEKLTAHLLQIIEFILDIPITNEEIDPLIETLLNIKSYIFEKTDLSIDESYQLISKIDSIKNHSAAIIIPGIIASIDLLKCLLLLTCGNYSENHKLIPRVFNNSVAPKWLKSIVLRFLLLDGKHNLEIMNNYNNSSADCHMVFQMDLWILCYASPLILKTNKHEMLDSKCYGFTSLLYKMHGWNDSLTINDIRSNSLSESDLSFVGIFPKEICHTIEVIYTSDIENSYKIYKSRKLISKGLFEQAKGNLMKLLEEINNSPVVIKLWWKPIITYWLSVSQAHCGNNLKAINGFKALVSGPKVSEANGQLLLILIKMNKFEEAYKITNSIDLEFPGTLYAIALLHFKKNNFDKVKEIVNQFKSLFGMEQKHYYHACIRLLALIEEKNENENNAIKLLKSLTLDESYVDVVAALRISRILVKQTYSDIKSHTIDGNTISTRKENLEFYYNYIPQTSREINCKLLFDILLSEKTQLNMLVAIQGKLPMLFSWFQIFIKKLLEINNFETIMETLNKSLPIVKDGIKPATYFEKTVFIIVTWNLLTHLWEYKLENKQQSNNEKNVYDEIARAYFGENYGLTGASIEKMPSLEKYIHLITNNNLYSQSGYVEQVIKSVNIVKDIISSSSNTFNNELVHLSNEFQLAIKIYLICYLPDEKGRDATIDEVTSICQNGDIYLNDQQTDMAQMIGCWYLKDYEKFLKSVNKLSFNGSVPIDECSLWLAKAFIWFKTEKYKMIFENDMPEKIADLSNSDVCVLMGKASALLAHKAWKMNNNKETSNYIKQAISALLSLEQIETGNKN